MNRWRRFFSLIPLMLGLLVLNVIFGSWVFQLITDTDPAHKVVLFVDAGVGDDLRLSAELERQGIPEGLRMIRAHAFDYAMLDSTQIRRADLYILPETDIPVYREWLTALPEELSEGEEVFRLEGQPTGLRIDPAGAPVIAYEPEKAPYYLCFGIHSLHVPGNENARDAAAVEVAESMLKMRGEIPPGSP